MSHLPFQTLAGCVAAPPHCKIKAMARKLPNQLAHEIQRMFDGKLLWIRIGGFARRNDELSGNFGAEGGAVSANVPKIRKLPLLTNAVRGTWTAF